MVSRIVYVNGLGRVDLLKNYVPTVQSLSHGPTAFTYDWADVYFTYPLTTKQYVDASFTTQSSVGDQIPAILVRSDKGANFLRIASKPTYVYNDATQEQSPATRGLTGTFRVEVVGTVVKVFQNGAQVATYSTALTNLYVGLSIYQDTANSVSINATAGNLP